MTSERLLSRFFKFVRNIGFPDCILDRSKQFSYFGIRNLSGRFEVAGAARILIANSRQNCFGKIPAYLTIGNPHRQSGWINISCPLFSVADVAETGRHNTALLKLLQEAVRQRRAFCHTKDFPLADIRIDAYL